MACNFPDTFPLIIFRTLFLALHQYRSSPYDKQLNVNSIWHLPWLKSICCKSTKTRTEWHQTAKINGRVNQAPSITQPWGQTRIIMRLAEYFIEIRVGKMTSRSDFLHSGESQFMLRIIPEWAACPRSWLAFGRPNVSHVFPSHRLTASSRMSVKTVANCKEIHVWLLKIWPA